METRRRVGRKRRKRRGKSGGRAEKEKIKTEFWFLILHGRSIETTTISNK